VIKHCQRLLERASLLTTAIHVKPAVIYVNIILDLLLTKHKAEDTTEETLIKASYYVCYSQNVRDLFSDLFLLQRLRSLKTIASLPCLIKQTFDLQGWINHYT
jgi:hypothetical protein